MAWYWIVLIVLGYLLITGVALALMVKTDDDDNMPVCVIASLLWPLAIAVLPFAFIVWLGYKLFNKIMQYDTE